MYILGMLKFDLACVCAKRGKIHRFYPPATTKVIWREASHSLGSAEGGNCVIMGAMRLTRDSTRRGPGL